MGFVDDSTSTPSDEKTRSSALLPGLHSFHTRGLPGAVEAYGWSYKPAPGPEFGFEVRIPGCWPLVVDPLGNRIIGASLPFYYWEDFDPEFHDDASEYRRQRQAFDGAFEAALKLAQEVLPPPFLEWTDADDDAYRAVIWEGEQGVFLLQQACFDPQFGVEIDCWLEGCSKIDFRPATPLIDWLNRRSQRLHAKGGFQPLQW
jgi:hypothetical protein